MFILADLTGGTAAILIVRDGWSESLFEHVLEERCPGPQAYFRCSLLVRPHLLSLPGAASCELFVCCSPLFVFSVCSFQEKEISSFEVFLLRQKAFEREELRGNEPPGKSIGRAMQPFA